MKKKNLAFTLAEVLIVIGIIGVVAALTLPNLNHATGDKERVTKVKKIYSSLTEAFDRAQVIYGDYDTWFNDLTTQAEKNNRFEKRMTEFIKISKDCGLASGEGCFSSADFKTLDGFQVPASSYDSASYSKAITADGMSLAFNYEYITVDIDGPNKGANRTGYDLFEFAIDTDKNILYPYGQFEFDRGWVGLNNFVTYWIIENDNADYLKADSTGKCNDSNIVLDWTTNTSCH